MYKPVILIMLSKEQILFLLLDHSIKAEEVKTRLFVIENMICSQSTDSKTLSHICELFHDMVTMNIFSSAQAKLYFIELVQLYF